MAYYNHHPSNDLATETKILGTVQSKGISSKSGKPYSIIKYETTSGTSETLYCHDACEQFDINDPVWFTIDSGANNPRAKLLPHHIGKVIRPSDGAPYIARNEGSRFYFDQQIDPKATYVVFFIKKAYDAQRREYGEAFHLIPKSFPADLMETDPSVSHRYVGQILKPKYVNQRFAEIAVDPECHSRNNLKYTKYHFLGQQAEWFFDGDRVTFAISSEKGEDGFVYAIQVKKVPVQPTETVQASLSDALSNIPAGLFSEPLSETSFHQFIFDINKDFKSRVYNRRSDILETEESVDALNISSVYAGRSSLFAALNNITAGLYLDRTEYIALLPRFKPFFDSAVPYLYANELGEQPTPEKLAWCISDFCDFLNTLFRAQRAENPLQIEIDRKNVLYPKFAEIIRYYIFKKALPLSDALKPEVALVLSGQSCWSAEDTRRLLQGSVWGEVYENPTEGNIQALWSHADYRRQMGKLCDLLRKRDGDLPHALPSFLQLLATVLKVCGRDALDDFMAVERSDNLTLMRDSYDQVQDQALAHYIDETCLGHWGEGTDTAAQDPEGATSPANTIIRAFNTHGLHGWPLSIHTSEYTDRLMDELYAEAKTNDYRFDYKLVAALLILFAKDGQFLKARFLYSLFVRHRTIKDMPLLSAIRQQIGREKTNEYSNEVVYYAFTHLPARQLYQFCCWASPLFTSSWAGNYTCDISDHLQNSKGGVFSYGFSKILLDAKIFSNWSYILQWFDRGNLYNYKNKYLFCVCQTIFCHEFHRGNALADIKDQLLLLLLSNNEKHKHEFHGLIYYVSEYMLSGLDANHEIAEALLTALERQMIIIPREDDPDIDRLAEYCKENLRDLQKPLYANLLIKLKSGRLTIEEIRLAAPFASGSDFIARELINIYEGDRALPHHVDVLLEALTSVDERSIYKARAFRHVWSNVIFCDRSRGEYGYLNEEEFNSFRQVCVDILKDYPEKGRLTEYLDSNPPLMSKLLLHACFVGIYSERKVGKIFKKLLTEADISEVCRDPETLNLYLTCMENQCRAELYFNSAYEDFYKYRRYVKLMIVHAVRSGADGLDEYAAEVNTIIKQKKHLSLVNGFGYEDFLRHLKQLLIELTDFDDIHKNFLLLSLLTEDIATYFLLFGDQTDSRTLPSLKKLLRHLDYREIHSNFFISNRQNMLDGRFNAVATQADLLSDEMSEIVQYLRGERDPHALTALVDQAQCLFDNKIHAIAVIDIIRMSHEMTRSARLFWSHVICAKQLPSKIIGEVRNLVLGYNEDPSEHKDDHLKFALNILRMLSEDKRMSYYYADAEYCEQYLSCLYDYFRQDVRGRDVDGIQPNRLPEKWVTEAERFKRQYAAGTFTPDNISNRSFGSSVEQSEFHLMIAKEFKISRAAAFDDRDFPYVEFETVYKNDHFDSDDLNVEDLIEAGTLWLLNKRKSDSPQEKIISVALARLVQVCDKASAGLKLGVWLDLFNHEKLDTDTFVSYLHEFQADLTVEDWLKHHSALYEILRSEFEQAYQCCLDLWSRLGIDTIDKDSCSEAQLLTALEQTGFDGYDSGDDYLQVIHHAVENRKKALKERKLVVNYEGTCESYAYFSVKNEGCKTVNLRNRLEVNNRFIMPEIGLDELRPGWITGFKCRGSNEAELSIVIQGKSNDELPLYRGKWLIDPDTSVQTETKKQLYNESALSDKETLFGRERTIEEIQDHLNHFGYVVMTGPSRVGKTSMINHLVSMAKANNAEVFAITEPEHYADHFTGKSRSIRSITEYLLTDTLTYGIGNAEVNRIITDGQSNRKPIRDIYVDIIRHLSTQNREIWLIFDEFQQIVNPEEKTVDERTKKASHLQPDANDMETLYHVLKKMMELPEKKIKIIFCGSDRLHKEIESPHSAWRKTLKAGQNNGFANRISVNNISKEAFKDMLVANASLQYTDDAIDAVASYSSQIPLYGKLICNQAIQSCTHAQLFCYDIAAAVSALFTGNDVMGIIEPVQKGLGRKDILYLEYLAKCLADGQSGEEIKRTLEAECGGEAVRASLNYARDARLLLNENEEQPDFYSAFFYKVFCKSEESKTACDVLTELKEGVDKGVDEAVQMIRGLNDDQKLLLLLKEGVFSSDSIQRLAPHIIYEGDHVEGDKTDRSVHIDTLNYTQVYQQFNAILQSDSLQAPEIAGFFDQLFGNKGSLSVTRYLSDDAIAQIEACSEVQDPLPPEIAVEIEKAHHQQTQDLLANIPFEEFMNVKDEHWKELLGIDDHDLLCLKGMDEYFSSLNFAVSLHRILKKIYDKGNTQQQCLIDFSPVAILYCKTIEKMLNDTHKPLYLDYLSAYDCAKPKRDGEYTLGDFSFAICKSKNNPYDWELCQRALAKATNVSVAKWKQHALCLTEISHMRNDTAHTDPTPYDKLCALVKVLFEGNAEEIVEAHARREFQFKNKFGYNPNFKRDLAIAISSAKREILNGNDDAKTGELLLSWKLGTAPH